MKVTSSGIVNGIIQDKYGKRGACNELGMPTYSLPLSIKDAPEETKSFAVVIDDKDAFPVSGGFTWVHWVAANICRTELRENESHPAESCSYYGGMAPPDAPHIYDIHVYALDTVLDLKDGFYMNEMYRKMKGHILGEVTISGEYAN